MSCFLDIPAICPACNAFLSFEIVERPVEQMVRDKQLFVTTEITECNKCKFAILIEGQLDKLMALTKEQWLLLCEIESTKY